MKFGAVLGIDVGWSKSRLTTGLCLIKWDDGHICVNKCRTGTDRASRQEAIADLVEGKRLLAVGIDGSLLPDFRISIQYRAPEALLSRGRFQGRGKPAPTSGGGGPRLHRQATELAKLVVETQDVAPATYPHRICEKAVVEAFPNAFLAILHPDDGFPARPGQKRRWTDTLFPRVRPEIRSLLDSLLPQYKHGFDLNDITGHEDIASFVCALTALCAVKGRCVAVGSRTQGWIILPPMELWGVSSDGRDRWARIALRENWAGVQRRFGDLEGYRNNEPWSP